MRYSLRLSLGVAALFMAFGAAAQKPIVYPAKGQSMQQFRTRTRASAMCGPSRTPHRSPVAASGSPRPDIEHRWWRARQGALRGALGGAVIGEIASDDAGKGAGIGAVLGTMRGGRDARHKQQTREQQAQGQQQDQVNTFYRAYGACMEGRGYTIK
jgi:hypothetical protein